MLPSWIIEGHALVERHVQQHSVTLTDLMSRCRKGVLHLSNAYARFELDVREVETNTRGVEVGERHLIDCESAWRWVKVLGCLLTVSTALHELDRNAYVNMGTCRESSTFKQVHNLILLNNTCMIAHRQSI